jgi:hypothetical protein
LPEPFVFWVHASTRARFEEAYKDIAERLELPGRNDPKTDVLRLVRNWLSDESNGQWTMILDNVDDIETFFPSKKKASKARYPKARRIRLRPTFLKAGTDQS